MELKLLLILLPLLTGSLNLFGESKPETLLLPITTLQLALIALELKSTPINSLVVMPSVLKMTLVIFMAAVMSRVLMDLELQVFREQEMGY